MTGIIHRSGHIPAQSYRVAMPIATHWEQASCEDVDCPAFRNGWVTILPVGDPLIATLRASGRSYREEAGDAGLLRFVFAAGQPCFRASTHRQQTDRPAIFIHGNRETAESRVVQPNEWQERFAETLDGLSDERKGR